MNSQKARMCKHKFGGWRAAQYLLIGLALGGWLAGNAFAQQEQASASETSKPVSAVSGTSKTSSSSSSSASASETSKPVSEASKTSSSSSSASASESYSSSSSEQSTSDATAVPTGINVGNYNIQSSLDLGWRYNNITGSEANYDTFINLHQGPRLFDFSFNAHSLNHNGALFDTLSLTGFGFGGDPVDVVRLRMSKNKWYDFNATYRRYKYFWGYNLLPNPLNPANTAQPITTAPHMMDLSHRMSDFQLTLLPQSSVRVRLGYTHSLEVGPSYSTEEAAVAPIAEAGAIALLFQNFKTTDDLYHAGIDFNLWPRTTLSYDQYIQHYKEDTFWNDANLNYQLPDGTPVDLGLAFSAAAGTSCNPLSTSTPVDPSCQANLLYDRGGRPRGTTPTERFSFQSTYFRNLNMTGQLSYSSGDQKVNDLFDTWDGLNTRILATGTAVTAASKAKRIIVTGNWSAVYQITSKLRAMDTFDYNAYRIPGLYNFGVDNFYAQLAPGGGYSMLLPPGQFNSTDCPPPYTASTCPQHNSSSGPDAAIGYRSTYLGQDLRSNTFQLAYDFNRKIGAHIGYRYTKRIITDFGALFYTGEQFYPGGSTDPATAEALAFRGDCALQDGQLPTGCTYDPNTGIVTFAGLNEAESDASHSEAANIDGNSALFGLWVKPASNFRTSFDMELFSADQTFTRITPRLLRHYQINSVYTPVHWAEITGAVDIVDSSNDVTTVYNQNHDRTYSLTTMFMPSDRFTFDLSYNYNDVYTQALVCYTVGFGPTPTGASSPCPVPGGEVNVAAIASYGSKTNFASADMTVKPVKQVTLTLGYAGSFVRGTPSWYNPLTSYSLNFLDPLTPWGPLRFNYQLPYMKLRWNVYKGLSYLASWNYYGYNTRGENNPVGLAPLGTQDFNGNNMTLSVKYAF